MLTLSPSASRSIRLLVIGAALLGGALSLWAAPAARARIGSVAHQVAAAAPPPLQRAATSVRAWATGNAPRAIIARLAEPAPVKAMAAPLPDAATALTAAPDVATSEPATGFNFDLQLAKVARTAAGVATNAAVIAGGAFGASGALTTQPGVIEYTLIYTNAGPDEASNVIVTDNIPAGTSFIDGSLVTDESAIPTANCQPLPNAASATQIKCTAATLGAGANGTITFRVRVPSSVASDTIITNKGQITASGTDDNPGDNTSNQTSNRVTTSADLSINKSDLGAAPVAGGPAFAYRLRVNNAGPSDARGITVTDALNANLAFVAVAGSTDGTAALPTGWTCTTPTVGSAGTVTCTNAQLTPAAGDQDLFIRVRVRPEATVTSINNRATITATSADPNAGDNARSINTLVMRSIILGITQSAAPSSVLASANLTYTLNVTNTGPSTALGVTVTDPLPADLTLVSATGTGIFSTAQGGSCASNAGEITCTPSGGQLLSGASATITIVAKVNGAAINPIGPNVARVYSSQADIGVDSNPVTVPIERRLDISLTKATSPAAVFAKDEITYTLRVTNTGPSDALAGSISLSDNIPANTAFLTGSIDLTGAPDFATVTANNTSLLFRNNNGVLVSGETATIKFRVTVDDQFTAGLITNTATLTASDDTNAANNTATATTAVGPNADLALTKTASAGPVTAGAGAITYTLNVRNNGPSAATGVRVTDVIPAGTVVTTAPSGTGFTCTGADAGAMGGVTFTCTPMTSPWPAGSTGTITYTVSVGPSVPQGPLTTNAATITTAGTGATPDAVPSNNTQSAVTTQVNAQADLSLIKERINPTSIPASGQGGTVIPNATILAGEQIAYRLSIRNDGPSDAQTVAVTDDIPAGASFVSVSASSAAFTCTAPAAGATMGTISCARPAFGGLFPATEQIFVVLRVLPGSTATSLVNIARVTSTTTDPNNTAYPTGVTPTSNADNDDRTDQITTVVDRQSAVTLTKRLTGAPANAAATPTFAAGELISYTIALANAGPSDAALTAAGLRDQLPADLTLVSFSGTGLLGGAACAFSAGAGPSGTFTCLPSGTVPAGATAAANTLTIVARIKPAAAPGALSNTAAVALNTVNNGGQSLASTATVNVVRRADLAIRKLAPSVTRAGDQLTYTLEVDNNGPSELPATAGAVTVTDVLPGNVTFISASATGPGNFTATGTATITFKNGAVFPVGQTARLFITVRAGADTADNIQISNTATVSTALANTTDPVSSNNSATAVVTTTSGAELALTKVANVATVEAGGGAATGRITYTIRAENRGPATANAIRIEDTLPAAANLVGTIAVSGYSFTPSPGATTPTSATGTCANDAGNGNRIICTSGTNTLLAGQGLQLTYTVEVPAGVAAGTSVVNLARITSSTSDPFPANNQAGTRTLVATGANVGVVKTASPTNGSGVFPGQVIDYALTVMNDGPATAQNVVVTDLLSAAASPLASSVALKFVSLVDAAGFTCTTPAVGASGAITCTRAQLPFTDTLPLVIRFKAMVDEAATAGTIDNRVSVTTSTTDPVTSDNASATQHPVGIFSTVAKTKSASAASVVAGDNLTYTLAITNNGGSDAQNIVLTDALPAGTSFVSFAGAGVFAATGACSFAAGTLTCTPKAGAPTTDGTLAAGATGTVQLVVKVAADIATNTVGPNSFSLASTTSGVAGTSNAVTVAVVRRSDLAITKTAPANASAGETFDYTITVRNNGPQAAAAGAVWQDTLPANTTFDSITPATANGAGAPSFGSCVTPAVGAGGAITCITNQAMPVNTTETLTVRVRVHPATPNNTALVNCAYFAAAEAPTGDDGPTDPTPANNQSCATTTARVAADLSVTKTAQTTGVAGQNIVYTIAFANAGPSDATSVALIDTIPANTTLQTTAPFNVALTRAGSPNLNATCALASNQITCTPTGNTGLANSVLPAGYSGTFTLTTKINAGTASGTVITNTATIAGANGADPNTANNTSAVTNTVVPPQSPITLSQIVQAAVTVASNPNQITPPAYVAGTAVVPGTNLTYRLTVANTGAVDASNITVTDTLPAGVAYVSATGTGFTCAQAGGVATCTAPTLAANSTRTIDLVVAIQAATKTQLTNTANASGIVSGISFTATTATLSTPVAPLSDLQLTATHTPEPVAVASNVTYTLTLRNNGPSTAAMVSLLDTLPAGQSLAAAPDVSGASGFTCAPNPVGSTGAITCTAAALAPGAQAVIKLTALVAATQPAGTVNNVVSASSMSVDPTPASVTDPVTIATTTDLVAAKTAPATVASGAQMTYTVTATNNGPAAASNVMISDPLPAGTVFVAATATGSTTLTTPAVNANGTVKATWSGATAAGTVRTLTVTVRVGSQVACDTNLANMATVSSDTTDLNTSNNTATATTKAQASFDLALTKTAPATAKPNDTFNYVLTVTNAGPSNATGPAGIVVTDTLPAGLTVVGTPTSSLAGTTFNTTTSNGVQTVTATLGALGGPNQTSGSLPTSATITIAVRVPLGYPFLAVTGTASVASAAACAGQGDLVATNNTATATTTIVSGELEAGVTFPVTAEASDGQLGSVLFFPLYSSNLANLVRENTRISVTNTSGAERACVRLFAVDGATCSVANQTFCLTANQTVSFQASDIDPGNRGSLIAVATDCATGLPRAFNYLLGDAFVKLSSGHAANLSALAVPAARLAPAGTNAAATSATLNFDGVSYGRLPRQIALDNIASATDGNAGLLVLNRAGGDLSNTAAGLGDLSGTLFNDLESGFAFTAQIGTCQLRQVLSSTFPRTSSTFGAIIPAGRSGWMKLAATNDVGLFGAYLNFNPNLRSSTNAYNQGHSLHTLTFTPAATLVIPVTPPTC